jgi:hypothetical protein
MADGRLDKNFHSLIVSVPLGVSLESPPVPSGSGHNPLVDVDHSSLKPYLPISRALP